MDKNVILAIVLSMLVLLTWQLVFGPRQKQIAEERVRQQELTRQPTEMTPEHPLTSDEPASEVSPFVEEAIPSSAAVQRQLRQDAPKITVETPLMLVTLTTQGARILEWKIKAHKDSDDNAVNLVSDDAVRLARLPLEVSTGIPALDDELNQGMYTSSVSTLELQPGMEPATIRLVSEKHQVTKELTFHPDSYKIEVTIQLADAVQEVKGLSVLWGPGIGANLEQTDRFNTGIVSKIQQAKPSRNLAKKIDAQGVKQTDVVWAAMDQKYFTAAMFPESERNTVFAKKLSWQASEEEKSVDPINHVIMGVSQPVTEGECRIGLYAGPKERVALAGAYAGFEKLIDYGMFWFIAEPLAWFMTFLYGYVKNYGVVIICLTILIKILFYPLTYKSFSSMQKMQTLQPKMKVIQEKYKQDRQQQQQEIMKLYRQEGVNPMGGCLPMVLQIPVFFALYQTLAQSIELRGAAFLWITDLSKPEMLFFKPLVLMMGVSMFVQQIMTPTVGDPKQAQMFKFMPILFTAMFWNFPAGLVLYWFMNNILTIGQQYLMRTDRGKTRKPKESDHTETTGSSRKRHKKGN